MISKDIYRTLVTELADEFKQRGYQRLKGTFPSWTRPIDGKFATVWFQAARQGGQFTIEFQFGLKPEPGTARLTERRQRLFALLDNAERQHMTDHFPKGAMSSGDDYWFLASNADMVSAVARWLGPRMELLMTRIASRANVPY